METVRLGAVGLGWFGGVLAEAARASGEAEVVACFARSEEGRRAFAEAHGCTPAESLEALLGDPTIRGSSSPRPIRRMRGSSSRPRRPGSTSSSRSRWR